MPATSPAGQPHASLEKGWRRAAMPAWEARWSALSAADRLLFLNRVEVAPAHYVRPKLNPKKSFPEAALQAWREAGLIADHDARSFTTAPAAREFLTRLVTLHQCRLLDPGRAEAVGAKRPHRLGQLFPYVEVGFNIYPLTQAIAAVVQRATGLGQYRIDGDPVGTFVVRRVWPDWVAASLDHPLAASLLEALEEADRPVPLARVPELLPGHDPAAVRAALDGLQRLLAVFEDLDRKTGDFVVGLLPEVAQLRRQKREASPAQPPPAVACEVGPEGGITLPDLRAFLLEVATVPPRLKQDGSLFQKEEERFLHALDPLPGWILPLHPPEALDARLVSAHRWAVRLQFVETPRPRAEVKLLRLSERGQAWLMLDREAQFAALAAYVRDEAQSEAYWGWNDHAFLASAVTAVVAPAKSRPSFFYSYGEMPAKEKQPLRDALHRLFTQLPLGSFFRVADVLAWGSDPARNPLLLGRPLREVVICVGHRQVPPLEEALEKAARSLLDDFIRERLMPLGCVQMGRDEHGQLLLARQPRLDVYFGKAAPAAAAPQAMRVVVQPDFTVVVIGLDAAPAAELAPFCDRQRGGSSHGSLTFRLSRESLLRAMADGISVEEMLGRLRRLASKAVPENVVTQLRAWASQVRKVTVQSAILFRCPDAATAVRVQQLLGKRADRVGETGVAWPAEEKLTPSLRKKLQEQGIFIEGAAGPRHKRPRG